MSVRCGSEDAVVVSGMCVGVVTDVGNVCVVECMSVETVCT